MIVNPALVPAVPLGSLQSTTTLIRANLATTYKGLESQGRGLLDVMARFLSVLHDGLDGSVAAICSATGLSARRNDHPPCRMRLPVMPLYPASV